MSHISEAQIHAAIQGKQLEELQREIDDLKRRLAQLESWHRVNTWSGDVQHIGGAP
jgi:ribosomal protein L29